MNGSQRSQFVYVIYIKTTPEQLWGALTDPTFIPTFWLGSSVTSSFEKGASWTLKKADGETDTVGEILEITPPRKMVIRWQNQRIPELAADGPSLCTLELEPRADAVKLTITHEIERSPSKLIEAVSGGWPLVLSNLKSVLETGAAVIRAR